MNATVTSQAIGSLDDLENTARQAADKLSQAISYNAVWDKAAKALKGGLADLPKTREDAKKESDQTHQMLQSLGESYDSDASYSVRKARTAVDKEISQLWDAMVDKERKFNQAKDGAAAAKKSLDESNEKFEQAQKKLLGVSKEIQDQQKQILALKTEVKDADNKHQLVEAIVKQEDLKKKLADFDQILDPEYEANLWKELNSAAMDLLEKTDALPVAQGKVSGPEADYKAAKTEYEDAVKNRIEAIKLRVADEESPVKGAPPKPAGASSPG